MNEEKPTNGRPMGRPPVLHDEPHPVYDETLGSGIITKLYEGATIHQACEYVGVAVSTLSKWRVENPDYAARFAQALEAYHDHKADSLLTAHNDIADTQKARLYSENVRWILAKRDKRYSDRIDVNVETRVSLADALKEAQGRVLSACYQVLPDATQAAESIDYIDATPTDRVSDSDNSELDDLLS